MRVPPPTRLARGPAHPAPRALAGFARDDLVVVVRAVAVGAAAFRRLLALVAAVTVCAPRDAALRRRWRREGMPRQRARDAREPSNHLLLVEPLDAAEVVQPARPRAEFLPPERDHRGQRRRADRPQHRARA
eukprot:30647-Pelagococcus_subviridis.AAC.3